MSTVIVIDSERYGLSPAEKKFNIIKAGSLTYAELEIQFTESFGYGLVEAFLNGVRIKADSPTSLKADVRTLLKNGENKLTVIFNALQIFGTALGQTTISAIINYGGASIVEIPSPQQGLDDFVNGLKKHAPIFLGVIIAGAIALTSVAFVSSRLPSLGGIKIKNPTQQISSSFNTLKSKVNL